MKTFRFTSVAIAIALTAVWEVIQMLKARREVSIYDSFEVADGGSFSIYTGMDLPTFCK